eukprot:1864804-Prymnesium_polylepis.2
MRVNCFCGSSARTLLRNPILKNLSIASLGVYASVCKYFVIVSPQVKHSNTQEQCDENTYQRRGWCRLEQWARLAVTGFDQMYLYTGTVLEPLANKPQWMRDSIHVFEGDFSVAQDKYALVDTVCGVWAHALRSASADAQALTALVQQHRASIFPVEYFGDLIDILEDRVNSLEFDEMVCQQDDLPPELIHLNKSDCKVQTGTSLQRMTSTEGSAPLKAVLGPSISSPLTAVVNFFSPVASTPPQIAPHEDNRTRTACGGDSSNHEQASGELLAVAMP